MHYLTPVINGSKCIVKFTSSWFQVSIVGISRSSRNATKNDKEKSSNYEPSSLHDAHFLIKDSEMWSKAISQVMSHYL